MINHSLASLKLVINEMMDIQKILWYQILITSLSGMSGKGHILPELFVHSKPIRTLNQIKTNKYLSLWYASYRVQYQKWFRNNIFNFHGNSIITSTNLQMKKLFLRKVRF